MIDSTRLTIRTNDVRSCRFYFHYIQANVPSSINLVFDVNNPDTALSCRIINDALEAYFPDNSARLGFIRRMELNLSQRLLLKKTLIGLRTIRGQHIGCGVLCSWTVDVIRILMMRWIYIVTPGIKT